ncbi:LysR family transcriptional regulator (plasmid) [Brevundimonas staleyi]|uniref:LysR family transcriptional regulator n=1 Tax=Brevundimonas staleyi TaxID=74326 RepID=A0ABW0FMA3_9CAUL
MSERSGASFDDIEAFVAVARNGGFTRAAEALDTSKSNVGKAVQRLEKRLGTVLLHRTTRSVRLTEDGETYLEAAQGALEKLAEAEKLLSARRAEPAGLVRIDFPSGVGRLILPTLADLRRRFPKITLEIALTDRFSDLTEDGWDIVVRAGRPPETGDSVVKRLCDMRLGLYAAPSYLAGRPAIKAIRDLRDHDAIIFRDGVGRLRQWRLQEQGSETILAPQATVILSDGQGFVDAAVRGLGIAQIFGRVAAPLIAEGRLVHLLPTADVDGPTVYAVVPFGRRMPAKTRAVMEHLVAVAKESTGLDPGTIPAET